MLRRGRQRRNKTNPFRNLKPESHLFLTWENGSIPKNATKSLLSVNVKVLSHALAWNGISKLEPRNSSGNADAAQRAIIPVKDNAKSRTAGIETVVAAHKIVVRLSPRGARSLADRATGAGRNVGTEIESSAEMDSSSPHGNTPRPAETDCCRQSRLYRRSASISHKQLSMQ